MEGTPKRVPGTQYIRGGLLYVDYTAECIHSARANEGRQYHVWMTVLISPEKMTMRGT